MYLQISLVVGLFAALLMFSGDMLLYFTTGSYDMDGTFEPYISIMKELPDWRIKLGGLLGPVAAFFYCIGFSQIVFTANEKYIVLANVSALFSALGIIIGGGISCAVHLFRVGRKARRRSNDAFHGKKRHASYDVDYDSNSYGKYYFVRADCVWKNKLSCVDNHTHTGSHSFSDLPMGETAATVQGSFGRRMVQFDLCDFLSGCAAYFLKRG